MRSPARALHEQKIEQSNEDVWFITGLGIGIGIAMLFMCSFLYLI